MLGQVSVQFPGLGWPAVHAVDQPALLLPACGITIVAFSDVVLTGRAFASPDEVIDANRELRALGAVNVVVGLLRGFPVSSSGSRTAIGKSAGGRTQLYSLVAMAVVVLALVVAGPAFAVVPTAALAAVVVYAAIELIDISAFRHIAAFRRSELVLALATTVSVLGLGVLYGVLAAVGLSILDLLRRVARPHDGILGYVPGVPGMHDVDDYPSASFVPGLVVYRYDAPLCFANAEDFRRRAAAAVREDTEWFLLNTEANVETDITSMAAPGRLGDELAARGVVFAWHGSNTSCSNSCPRAVWSTRSAPNAFFPPCRPRWRRTWGGTRPATDGSPRASHRRSCRPIRCRPRSRPAEPPGDMAKVPS